MLLNIMDYKVIYYPDGSPGWTECRGCNYNISSIDPYFRCIPVAKHENTQWICEPCGVALMADFFKAIEGIG